MKRENLRQLDRTAWEKDTNRTDGKHDRPETVERHGRGRHMMMMMHTTVCPATLLCVSLAVFYLRTSHLNELVQRRLDRITLNFKTVK